MDEGAAALCGRETPGIVGGRHACGWPRPWARSSVGAAVLTHHNATRLAATDYANLAILQSDEVAFRGQFVGGVIAETLEVARQAASLVRVDYQERAHDVELRADRDDLYTPHDRLPDFPMDTALGDVEAGLASAAVRLDATYTTPMEHHNPMEPHATIAIWTDDGLTLYLSSQGVHGFRATVAQLFGLDPQQVRVISPHVGGGFGSKARAHADVILAALAARHLAGRPVKLALTRQQMFSQVGYRTPTIQRIRLGADTDGRLTAIAHDVVEQTARLREFAEQSTRATPTMYAAPNRRTTQRLAALDVSVPEIMRAPGETPGMFALESAMDELAIACGLDPIELRIRNEPEAHPQSGLPFSSRNLVACLREGAHRFGWERRDPTPGPGRRRAGWSAPGRRRGRGGLPGRGRPLRQPDGLQGDRRAGHRRDRRGGRQRRLARHRRPCPRPAHHPRQAPAMTRRWTGCPRCVRDGRPHVTPLAGSIPVRARPACSRPDGHRRVP